MCGIAGIVDLAGGRPVPGDAVRRMAAALYHRGPDDDGFFFRPGLALASRRLSIVGLADGRQPVSNEDGSIVAIFNGELFDHREKRAQLAMRGHRWLRNATPRSSRTSGRSIGRGCSSDCGASLPSPSGMNDSDGSCWLVTDSESAALLVAPGGLVALRLGDQALLASGMVAARPDRRGIDHLFSFSALPGPITCFEDVQLLRAGHFMEILPSASGGRPDVRERAYWQMDFPDAGQEDRGDDEKKLVDRFEQVLLQAVDTRLKADVPVASYLSGGVDSGLITALARHLRGPEIDTYTIRVDAAGLDELDAANLAARHIGLRPPIVQAFRAEDAVSTYPALIRAAEAPVMDTSCAALLKLAERVHQHGQKAVLSGQGADEWLIGYPWYKGSKLIGSLDILPGVRLSDLVRRSYLRLNGMPQYPPEFRRNVERTVGGPNAWIDSYGLLGLSKLRFYSESMHAVRRSTDPWADLQIPLERARRWHPLNRGIWIAGRVTLAGHLLQAKGDRVAMHSSVEVRYPFLDEAVFDFLAPLHPDLKLRGLRDKHLLREVAARWLPEAAYKRRKAVFRAPLDSFHLEPEPKYVAQLLSEESLKKTGYFDPAAVRHWRKAHRTMRAGLPRYSIESGLAAVVATQLWHHTYIDHSLADL